MPRVLLVDDAEDILDIAQIGFDMAGWECQTASNGTAALELACLHGPDLILLDFDLPGENGLAILKRLRNEARVTHIPVLFLTATTDEKQRCSMLGAGACGIISKPFDPLSLPQQVASYLP